jgi:hypothetical protein
MADGPIAERTLYMETHRSALASTGIGRFVVEAHGSSSPQAGAWQTASILLPSGSKTNAP